MKYIHPLFPKEEGYLIIRDRRDPLNPIDLTISGDGERKDPIFDEGILELPDLKKAVQDKKIEIIDEA